MSRLNELYFEWLYNQVDFNFRRNSMNAYTQLLSIFHNVEFVWIVPNDDNRMEDARELRFEFLKDGSIPELRTLKEPTGHLMDRPISMLEVLIALSRRCAWADSEAPPQWWAWKLIDNLQLSKMKDPLASPKKQQQVKEALDAVIWRTYKWDGVGGFFPLAYPRGDQTREEIWTQMHAFLMENQSP